MDNMLEHPGTELQVLIKEKGLTQKAFALILGKKVSEVNELLKGKRNITIQRDYLLHQTLGTPIKYWILKQVDYDYSLIDINEENTSNNPGSVSMTDPDGNTQQNENGIEPGLNGAEDNSPLDKEGLEEIGSHSEQSEESTEHHTVILSETKDLKGDTSEFNTQDSFHHAKRGKLHSSEGQDKDDEDRKNRAKIFKSF